MDGRFSVSMETNSSTKPEATKRFCNYEDFRKWTETQAGYWMLVRGEPMPSPSPSRIHQKVSKRLQVLLMKVVEDNNLGEVYNAPLDVTVSGDTVYQPDLLVVLNAHADRMRETHIEGAPDLVVEILSPSTARMDLMDKRFDYASAGVSEYWIVDPQSKTVEIFHLKDGPFSLSASAHGKGTVTSLLLPQLTVNLDTLFREL